MVHGSLLYMLRCKLFLLISTQIAAISSALSPLITNSSGEYWIASAANASGISYASQNITCSTSNCYIACDTYHGCYGAMIDANISTRLILTCSANQSCANLSIVANGGPSDYVQIDCLANGACQNAQFNVEETNTVDIQCADSTKANAACHGTNFQAPHAFNVSLLCSASSVIGDCFGATLNVNYTNVTSIDGFDVPLYVFAEGITSKLSINAHLFFADSNIYCPHDAVHGCVLNLTSTNYSDQSSSNRKTIVYCGNNAPCVINAAYFGAQNAHIHCSDIVACTLNAVGHAAFYNSSIHCGDNIDCDLSATENWQETFRDATIYCGANAPCTVQCTSYQSCRGATVYCPTTGGNACSLECTEMESCGFASIHCREGSECVIDCQGTSSCAGQQLYLPDANYSQLNLTCDDQWVCNGITFDCVNSSLTSAFVYNASDGQNGCDDYAGCCPYSWPHTNTTSAPQQDEQTRPKVWVVVVISCVGGCFVAMVVYFAVHRREPTKPKRADLQRKLLPTKDADEAL